MKTLRKCALVLIILALAGAVNTVMAAQTESLPKAKGIILLIGDGMGINQVRSADLYAKHVLKESLAINSIRTRGITTTYSADSEVTDSSSAATALYTGYKINNSVLNILPDGKDLFTIGHAAKKSGLSVGVVTTTRITHATPAAVYSRSPHRDCEAYIAEQLPEFAPEVVLGGGKQYFMPQNATGSKRKDQANLIQTMESKGYYYVTKKGELSTLYPETNKLFGLFANSHMDYALDRENEPGLADQPSLADMTKAALSILEKNPKGFFIMIEGGRIDHACHAHDIKASIYETLDFDSAVKVALEFQKTHPDILVLVTADHETGGLGLGRGTEYALAVESLKPIKNTLEYLNKKIKKDPAKTDDFIKAAGFELTEKEKGFLVKHSAGAPVTGIPELHDYPKVEKYVGSCVHYSLSCIESERCKIGWTSFGHTAQPVITCAVGPGESEFSGCYDNTDIAKKMAKLLGLTLDQPVTRTTETGSKCQP
jgi:alkaline phosphatase